MKAFVFNLIAVLAFCFTGVALADVVTVPEVPITVDTGASTYTVGTGVTVPTTGDYYYVYPGHRCYTSVQTTMSGNYVVYSGTPNIYCYSYP